MQEVRGEVNDNTLTLYLSGHIDSGNAPQAEEEIQALVEASPDAKVRVDASDLNYISSAGLRVLLHLRKTHPELAISGVNSDVYEILDMTGFTQMMTVEKAYRTVSIEGAEEIGRGANGTIYRIDKDNVVKVYNNADALADIQHEREVARTALVLGIPTAISYDVVRVGDSYGSVFELLDAKSFSEILADEPDKMDWCVKEYVELLKKIHSTVVPKGELPEILGGFLDRVEALKAHFPEEVTTKLRRLFETLPKTDHMIHGDYHTKNVEKVGDEILLIDMDTLAVGHPIFELGSMYNAFIGFSELDPTVIQKFQGFDIETSKTFWSKVLAAYLGTTNEKQIRAVEDKARIVGYTRLIARAYRLHHEETEDGKKLIDHWTAELFELLDRTETLHFAASELIVEADKDNLQQVVNFVDEHLESAGCPPKVQMQIDIAVEEIFVNIANYAYHPNKGKATVRVEVDEEPIVASITFIDKGVPYDPLAKEDPDVTLSAEQRQIGGLGIFMVKQSMDDVLYEYKDGQNILTLKKKMG